VMEVSLCCIITSMTEHVLLELILVMVSCDIYSITSTIQ
jgi:hypothetical protein